MKECHVLNFDVFEIPLITYEVFKSAELFNVANFFTLEPACDYEISYSLAESPPVADQFYYQDEENPSIWFISTYNTSLTKMYDFTATVTLVGYPTDAPFDGSTEIIGINTSGANLVSF